MSSKKYGSSIVQLARKFRVHRGVTPRLIESFLSSLDCPRALAVWLMFSNREHDQLAGLKFNPLDYNSQEESCNSYLATKYLSKFDSLSLTVNKEEAAWAKFRSFEERCKSTNLRFRRPELDPLFRGPVVWLHQAVKFKIEKILGEFCAEEMVQSCTWGPGATTLIKRRDASHSKKFQFETGITRDLYDLVPFSLLREAYPLWGREVLERSFPNEPLTFCVGNKVITVPKDASTDRIIAVEPGLNLWFQQGLGECIRRRLLRVGVNLRDQRINQEYARQGSLTGEYATVDLSSASDSIATELVRELLPPRWFSVMDSCRSRLGRIGDQWVEWSKFSSMGNGFTFPLESLIFYAAAKAAAEYVRSVSRVCVYGDDIVLPVSAYKLFSDLMDYYGFQINETKTYKETWFRESCGAHWYRGVDIKPAYLKSRLSSALTVFRAANTIRRLAHRRKYEIACDLRFKEAFDFLMAKVPKQLRLRIPETLGDGGFIGNFDEATPARASTRKWPFREGYLVKNLITQVDFVYDDKPGYFLARLWSMPTNYPARVVQLSPMSLPSSDGGFSNRADLEFQGCNNTPTHRLRLECCFSGIIQWYDLGPWI